MASQLGVTRVAHLRDLSASGLALFDTAPGFATSRTWFAATEASALPAGAEGAYIQCGGTAVFPMMVLDGQLHSMTTPYTWEFAPVSVRQTADAALLDAAAAFGRACRAWPVTLIEALDETSFWTAALGRGLRHAGLLVRPFAHFGNWQEPVGHGDWATYIARRPGRLREVLRRRSRDAGASLRFDMIDGPGGIEDGIAAYAQVYVRSWKVPEPYPDFGPTLLRAAAAEGSLRLAVLWREGAPIAAQYWVLRGGTATVLKLAHDEAAKALSPGTLLTAWAIRRMMEADQVQRLDFGRGDDAYKQLWATERRQRIGLVAGAPWHPRGLAAIGRQVIGELRQHMLRHTVPGVPQP